MMEAIAGVALLWILIVLGWTVHQTKEGARRLEALDARVRALENQSKSF